MTDFGPAVIGEEEFEKQQRAKADGSLKFGPLVLEPSKNPNRPADAPKTQIVDGDVSSLSVKDLKEVLEEDPGLTLQLLDAELERPDVRISALRALQYAEKSKPQPSETILGRIDEAKAELGDDGDEDDDDGEDPDADSESDEDEEDDEDGESEAEEDEPAADEGEGGEDGEEG